MKKLFEVLWDDPDEGALGQTIVADDMEEGLRLFAEEWLFRFNEPGKEMRVRVAGYAVPAGHQGALAAAEVARFVIAVPEGCACVEGSESLAFTRVKE